ncbi:MAG: phosphoribosylformylglycinamidine synthase subunit PurQ, partial [Alphaproteobacteria bacterium]
MKIAIIQFPGINRERDMCYAVEKALGFMPVLVWHKETSLPNFDLIILPGGFSFGDYLRSGAIAAHSPIMRAIKAQATRGAYILGICNGFQILTEAGLLPGALLRNQGLKFMCKHHSLKIEMGGKASKSPLLAHYQPSEIINLPLANNDGNYQIDQDGLNRLQGDGLIAMRYA